MITPILHVHDVDFSLAFYTLILGFKGESGLPGMDGATVYAEAYLGEARLMFLRDSHAGYGFGCADLYLSLPDAVNIDAFYARLCAREVAIVREMHEELWGDCAFTICDLDGNRLTFAQPRRRAVAA